MTATRMVWRPLFAGLGAVLALLALQAASADGEAGLVL